MKLEPVLRIADLKVYQLTCAHGETTLLVQGLANKPYLTSELLPELERALRGQQFSLSQYKRACPGRDYVEENVVSLDIMIPNLKRIGQERFIYLCIEKMKTESHK